MATQIQVEEYRTATATLTTLAQSQIRDVLASFSVRSDPVRVRDALLQWFPDFMTAFGDTAAVLGADFYDLVRDLPPSAGTVLTVLAQPAKTKQSEGAVRWAVGALFVGDWGSFESSLLGASQRLVLQPSRETIDLLSQADARAEKAAAVGWSRQVHPERAESGESCDFCMMLAGRGPVYGSAASAGGSHSNHPQAAEWHDRCNCVAVPTFYQREMQSRTERGFTRDVPVLVPIS